MASEAEVPEGEAVPDAARPPEEGQEPGRIREVTGYEDTFEEAVSEGLVPSPPLMPWNGWQRWRREQGGRPTMEDDGVVPRPRDESALWRRVMEHYHGPQWADTLRAALPASRGPGAGADYVPPAPLAGAGDRQDGDELGALAAAAVGPLGPAPRGPGDRAAFAQPAPAAAPGAGLRPQTTELVPVVPMTPEGQTAEGSDTSSHLPTPRGLLTRLDAQYNPSEEQLADYQARIRRIVDACSYVGAEVDYDRLERNLIRAEFLDQIKSAPPQEAVNELRSLAVARLTAEVPLTPQDRARMELETEVLVDMLRERGVAASLQPERLFFSGISSPARSPGTAEPHEIKGAPGTSELPDVPTHPARPTGSGGPSGRSAGGS